MALRFKIQNSKLKLLDEPVLITDLIDEVELGLTPVLVFFLVLEVGFEEVEGGDVVGDFSHALAEELDAGDGDLKVCLDVFARVVDELFGFAGLVLELAAEVEETADELVHPAHFLVMVSEILLA